MTQGTSPLQASVSPPVKWIDRKGPRDTVGKKTKPMSYSVGTPGPDLQLPEELPVSKLISLSLRVLLLRREQQYRRT